MGYAATVRSFGSAVMGLITGSNDGGISLSDPAQLGLASGIIAVAYALLRRSDKRDESAREAAEKSWEARLRDRDETIADLRQRLAAAENRDPRSRDRRDD